MHHAMQLRGQVHDRGISGLVGKGMICITCLVKKYHCYIPLKNLLCNLRALDSFSNGELFLQGTIVCFFQLCYLELFTISRHRSLSVNLNLNSV